MIREEDSRFLLQVHNIQAQRKLKAGFGNIESKKVEGGVWQYRIYFFLKHKTHLVRRKWSGETMVNRK